MTQHKKIWRYLCLNGEITPMDAFKFLHITKLSTRIGEMLRAGYPILKETVWYKDSDGKTAHYTRYFITEFDRKKYGGIYT